MVRIIFYLVVSLLALANGNAQSKYETGMQKAFDLWKAKDIEQAEALFERIASAAPDAWLPHYYIAQINTFAAYKEKEEQRLTLLLEKAKAHIDEAKIISPNNAEILVQEAMINTAWIAFDGATYGMTLSGKVTQLYNEALQLAPNNPRVVFAKAEWDMGSARYFGKDTAPYCKDVAKALELFTTFKIESEFHPNWGEKRALQILENCE
ncbi:hypothetical protein ACFQ1M_01335 [Sungkyunkwania multivorans]|uniref:Tetratricopeptide repeat protein n=1 Tax=Sungkyunkwania multivorans TaxID=1173618 RepID=A0ABW3CUH2_9FLAO